MTIWELLLVETAIGCVAYLLWLLDHGLLLFENYLTCIDVLNLVREWSWNVIIVSYFTVIFLMKYAIIIVHSFVVRLYSYSRRCAQLLLPHVFNPNQRKLWFCSRISLDMIFVTQVNVNILFSWKQIALLILVQHKLFLLVMLLA
jgi:hypothetical protein